MLLFLICSATVFRFTPMARSSALRHPAPPQTPPPNGGAPAAADSVGGAEIAAGRRRGRGAHSNASGRYEPLNHVAFDDGWQSLDELPAFKTSVAVDAS